jgi:hypothetical protein
MVTDSKQTFIPKKPLLAKNSSHSSNVGIFFIISLIIFLISIGLTIFAYSYSIFLKKRVENMSTSLERAKSAFEPSLIVELKRVNARINEAENILKNHVSFSEFFKVLEEDTLKSIRFKQFNYSLADNGDIDITISGEAKGYSSIALQSDLFGENKYIKNPIFSNLGLDNFGNITFNMTASVDKSLILYK